MMVNELRKVANIGEDMLKRGVPDNLPSDTTSHHRQVDESTEHRKSTSNNFPRIHQQYSSTDEHQATSRAFDGHPSSPPLEHSQPSNGVSPHPSLTYVAKDFGNVGTGREESVRIPGASDDNVSKVTAELSKLFENASRALKALTAPSEACDKPFWIVREGELPKLPSECQAPCANHSLAWLEEQVTYLASFWET